MIEHQGIYLPDGEVHLVGWMTKNGEMVDGKGTYQIKKLRAAVSYCPRFRSAVDVGAHCGLWSMQLAKRFAHVYSFEPVSRHRECFTMNNGASFNVTLHPFALGDHDGFVSIESAPDSSGDSRVAGDGDIPLRKLDDFEIDDVDLIKLDAEGYELFALRGGEQTIKRCKPVVIVEQKPGRAQRFGLPETGAVDYLKSLGYKLQQNLSGDFILTP